MKAHPVILLGVFLAASNVWGDTSWINSSSGFWREPANWSLGLPYMGQPVTHIAFGGESKTVTVDAETVATNLVVQRLNISGPGITNTLLLTEQVTLEVRSTLEMRAGSALHIVNSTLRMPSEGSSFDINAGEVLLQSGSILASNVSSRIGRDAGVAIMRVEGGAARLNEVLIGRRVTRSGADGTLLVSGGLVQISGNLDVGADTNCTGRIVVTGGELIATALDSNSAIGEQGNGVMIVSNGVVHFDNLDVGRHTNVIGSLYIAGGSNVIEDLSIARFPESTGMVFQTAGEFLVTDILRVGREGRGEMTLSGGTLRAEAIAVATATNTASGLLTIDGGTMLVGSNLVVGTAISRGEVVLAGGLVAITNETSSATLEVSQGTATLSGGSLAVDRLRMVTNSGFVLFNQGLLSSAGTVVSNGLPFVVGDGISPATFHLRGGTHYFQNGLVISPNATLTGCGTIIGIINNQGTIATNCTPNQPIFLENPAHAAGEFSFSFQSAAGLTYIIEHAAAVDAPTWQVLTTTNGTGSPIIIRDSALPGRYFYRVKLQ